MKLLLRFCAVIIYFLCIYIGLGSDLSNLFSMNDFFILFVGAILFLSISFIENKGRKVNLIELVKKIRQSLLVSGIYSSVLLLFVYFLDSKSISEIGLASKSGEIIQIIFIKIRPFLYSISLYLILFVNEKEEEEDESDPIIDNTIEWGILISKLSKREKEIAQLISIDLSNKEIGERLFISPLTVKKHVYNIFSKLNISQRSELKYRLNKKT